MEFIRGMRARLTCSMLDFLEIQLILGIRMPAGSLNLLFGATNGRRTPNSGARSYLVFKPNMLFPATKPNVRTFKSDSATATVTLRFRQRQRRGTTGYNPPSISGSTAGLTTDPPTATITPTDGSKMVGRDRRGAPLTLRSCAPQPPPCGGTLLFN